jgi:hypothetical protein
MVIKFEYTRELPTPRLGDGLPDWYSKQHEIVCGELSVEMFLNQISNEISIRDIKIFNIDGSR